MKFDYLPVDPNAKGLQQIAEMYVSESVDLSATYRPSATFSALVDSDDASEEIRALLVELVSGAEAA